MMENSVLTSATFTGLLFTASSVRADTPYTSTGWVKGSPVPPIAYTNAANQVLMRGSAHLVAVQSTDARLTGNRLVFANASYQADGTAHVWGNAYQSSRHFRCEYQLHPHGRAVGDRVQRGDAARLQPATQPGRLRLRGRH